MLGKRGRNLDDDTARLLDGEDEDDSDDDVGPMPLPAGANGGTKRKRRGESYDDQSMNYAKLNGFDAAAQTLTQAFDAKAAGKLFRDPHDDTTIPDEHVFIVSWVYPLEHFKRYRNHGPPVRRLRHHRHMCRLIIFYSDMDSLSLSEIVNLSISTWIFHNSANSKALLRTINSVPSLGAALVLVGDAAHIHSPADDQGMNLAIRASLLSRSKSERISMERVSQSQNRTDFIITTSVDGHLKFWKKHWDEDGQLFASISEDGSAKVFDVLNFDHQIRMFAFLKGKLTRKHDESLTAIQEMQQASTSIHCVEDMEFGRRLAVERELEMPGPDGRIPAMSTNVVWDESGAFVLYPTLLGIKVVNTVTNHVVRLQGKDESVRWMNLALYQGAPAKKGLAPAMTASANPMLANKSIQDPTLFCTGYKRQRFYLFTRSEPEDSEIHDKDIFNERPTRKEQSIASATALTKSGPSPFGFIRTGFTLLVIQTGDPLGNGTGGTSIWDREFEDEFSPDLKHDHPYTISFFITTTATPWLDKKHTIFGCAISGLEVIHNIENVKTDKMDKPFEVIKIVNVVVETDWRRFATRSGNNSGFVSASRHGQENLSRVCD
ncbi:hypothetical protein EV424DRAFT_1605397 [Suillus variegatus]|nr:hypothetical protein EV424DRAFT_1605397 [Suillus variegatus]